MKTKRFLSLFIAIILCLSSFTAFAADDPTEEIFVVSSPEEEYVDYSNMYYFIFKHKKGFLLSSYI